MLPRPHRRQGRPKPVKYLYWLLVLALSLAGLWMRHRPEIAGTARAIDGDSLVVEGIEMRLKGIDAPEGRQTCQRDGRSWPCGHEAQRHLARLAASGPVRCTDHGADQHKRRLATCYVDAKNLNEAMVRDGFAVAYGSYENAEAEARAARRGLWSGTFERPRDWRDHNMR